MPFDKGAVDEIKDQDIDSKSIQTGELTHTPQENPQSVAANLAQGKPVLVVSGTSVEMKSIDPTNGAFTDDSNALQTLIDAVSAPVAGDLYLPAFKPNGSEWSFPAEVELASTSDWKVIHLHGVGFGKRAADIRIPSSNSFSSGDAIFSWDAGTLGGGSKVIVDGLEFLIGSSNNADPHLFTFRNMSPYMSRIGSRDHRNFFCVIDSAAFEWTFQSITATGAGTAGGGVKLQDTDGNPPGKGHIQDGVTFLRLGQPGLQVDGGDEAWFNGNMEGDETVQCDINAGQLYVGPAAFFDSSGSAGDGAIDFNGNELVINDGATFQGFQEDAIVVNSADRFDIGRLVGADSVSSNIINIATTPSRQSVVPIPETMGKSKNVSYPGVPWDKKLVYTDGWSKVREGTTTVNAGDTGVTLTAFGGKEFAQLKGPHQGAGWRAKQLNDPLEFEFRQVINTSNAQIEWLIDEVSGVGSGSADIVWEVHRQD